MNKRISLAYFKPHKIYDGEKTCNVIIKREDMVKVAASLLNAHQEGSPLITLAFFYDKGGDVNKGRATVTHFKELAEDK